VGLLLLVAQTVASKSKRDASRVVKLKLDDESGHDGSSKDQKIFHNLEENYKASSSVLDAVTKRYQDDLKKRQAQAREDWKRTFEEIKDSNPTGFNNNEKRNSGGKLLERWKQLLDGEYRTPSPSGPVNEDSRRTKPMAPTRFDGGQNWEKQLDKWSDDVTTYLAETESQINELLQPRESSQYDLGNFGVSQKQLANITKGEASAPGTLPIALTALEPNLPPIPKPRPATADDDILPDTNIADKSKNIWIVTTGALPWMTGTAVNPMLRAAYLSTGRKQAGGSVTIMLPWVERPDDQKRIYGEEAKFAGPEDQEQFIRKWLRETANMKDASEELNIRWYTAWQEVLENSLYSMGDIIGLIPEEECDICVLEEPEHLNWYRAPGENWTSKFKHVVGIIHTNYFVYATEQPAAFIRAPGMRLLSSWMCRAHCHRVIKLSGTLQQFAPEKELVENVHGVRRTFLDIGDELRCKLTTPDAMPDPVFGADATPAVYFIGKMLWSKGIDSLMELIKYAEESADLKVKVDMYGGGPDKDEASERAAKMGLEMPFHGPVDHSELGWTHKVFINPSTSEVLCTTVAEALAMGKFVVLPSHPSNDFFAQFPNCLPYTNKEEFVGNLYYALTHEPEPLSSEYSRALSWEAATERFAAAGSVSFAEAEAMKEALSSADAGIDIVLPPLISGNEVQRKKLSRTFRLTRRRYRNFRSRLSQELSKTNVLPQRTKDLLITELDKRLNVDLDELLSSPKLRVKLSPAKLDKLLLDLYDGVVQGESGDVFRVIGGGANVGRQNRYVRQQTRLAKNRMKEEVAVDVAHHSVTPTSLVKRALRRNLPRDDRAPKMTLVSFDRPDDHWRLRQVRSGGFAPPILRQKYQYSPLI